MFLRISWFSFSVNSGHPPMENRRLAWSPLDSEEFLNKLLPQLHFRIGNHQCTSFFIEFWTSVATTDIACSWMHCPFYQAAVIWKRSPPVGGQLLPASLWDTAILCAIDVGCWDKKLHCSINKPNLHDVMETPKMGKCKFIYEPQPFSITAYQVLVHRGLLEPIPASKGQEAGYTLNRSPAYWGLLKGELKDRHSLSPMVNLSIQLTRMSLHCGRKPTHEQGEHANSTEKGQSQVTSLEPNLLWGDSANQHTTLPPSFVNSNLLNDFSNGQ